MAFNDVANDYYEKSYNDALETCRKEVEEELAFSHNNVNGKTLERLLEKGYTRERAVDAIAGVYASYRTEAYMYGRSFSIEYELNRL